jgi:hypothetical protein
MSYARSFRRRSLRRSLDPTGRMLIPAAQEAIIAHLTTCPSRNTVTDIMLALRDAGFSASSGRGWFEGYLESTGFILTFAGTAGGGNITRVSMPEAWTRYVGGDPAYATDFPRAIDPRD